MSRSFEEVLLFGTVGTYPENPPSTLNSRHKPPTHDGGRRLSCPTSMARVDLPGTASAQPRAAATLNQVEAGAGWVAGVFGGLLLRGLGGGSKSSPSRASHDLSGLPDWLQDSQMSQRLPD